MNKLSDSFTLGFVLALICLPPLHAQTVTNEPAGANAAAASPAPVAQAPDDVTNKISELVHDGKYAEAQGLTTGLLLAYPNDERLIKAKALIEKLLAPGCSANAAPSSNRQINDIAPAQPATNANAEQLTGMDKVDYNALIELAREAQSTMDLAQQWALLAQFMEGSGRLLQKHPKEMLLWQLRGAAAISLNWPIYGYQAGERLLAAGAADSNDSSVQRLLGQLKNKGWLDKQEAEKLQQIANDERKQAQLNAAAEQSKAEDDRSTFPVRHMNNFNWGYGHLTIAANNLVYDGSDGHIQFSNSDLREVTVNGGFGGLNFIRKGGKSFVFVVIPEAAVPIRNYPASLSPTGIGNAIASRWKFTSTDNKTMKPPTP